MAIVRALAFSLLAALSLAGAAAPFGVRLGLERIVLDVPPGFTDTTELASPRLQDLAATLTSDSNRILLFALTDTDMRRFTQGDPIEARRYLIAVTPKGLERERVSAEQFAVLVTDSRRGTGKPVATSDYIKFLESQPIGKVNLFSELKKEPTVTSVLQATRQPPQPGTTFWESSKPQYLFFTTTLLLVGGKALRLDVYTTSVEDIDWLKRATERWIDDLLRLNAR